MIFSELQAARRLLGLGDRATLQEIKTNYRNLARKHHPDSNTAGNPETIRQVNAAYRLVSSYVGEYRFSFSEEEFYEQNPEERIRQQFMTDPLWGKG